MSKFDQTNYDVIGKGKYSVVVKPAVTDVANYRWYVSYRDKDDSDVSKLFINHENNVEDFTREYNILIKISEIENYTDFTVPFKGASTINTEMLSNNFELLKLLEADNTCRIYQIILGHGGLNLHKMNEQISYETFILLIEKFYKGIEVLHQNNIIHRDLKPMNVLYDGKQLNIVDYGLACSIDEVFNKNASYFILEDMYMYHPPEFYVAHLLFQEPDELTFQEKVENVFSNLTTINKVTIDYYDKHYYRYHNKKYDIEQYIQCFRKMLSDIKTRELTTFEELFTKEIAVKCDIYSSSFILRSLARNVQYQNDDQNKALRRLHDMTYSLNPFDRSSLSDVFLWIKNQTSVLTQYNIS